MSKTEVLDEVLAEYLEAERRGQAPPQDTWVAHHPQLSGELRSFLADRDSFRLMAATLPTVPFVRPVEPTVAGGGTLRASIVGNYEIVGELGHGGMGVVYKARQLALNRLVALKMVLESGHIGSEALVRFRAEAEAVARLKHPNIVQIYEVGTWEGRPFFSLEFIDGGTLAQRIAGQPQPMRQAAALVETLAQAMDYAHQQGIVHRDLKPANVLLTTQGMPKVTDFGLAKHLEKTDGETRTGAILGTPSYIAPEQAAGKKDVGPAADIYALGTVLYEMLTGRPPFKGETPMETMLQVLSEEPLPPSRLNGRVPHDLETICLKCLCKEPPRRYGRAAELAADLRRFLLGESIQARPAGMVERSWRWCRRNRVQAALLAAVVGLVFCGGILVFAEWRRAEANLAVARAEWKRAEDNAAEVRKQRDLAESNAAAVRKERDRAEKNFDQARSAVDKYFTRVSENSLLNRPGLQGLRRELLEEAVKYYQDFLGQHTHDSGLKFSVADTHKRLGIILNELGRPTEALASFEKAIRLYQDLAARQPQDRQAQRGLVHNYLAMARMQSQLGRLDDAIRSNNTALERGEALLRDEPTNLLYQDDLIIVYDTGAHLKDAAGFPDQALATYELGRARLEKMIAVEPSWNRRYHLALFLRNIANSHLDAERTAPARPPLEQALPLLKKLLEEQPLSFNVQRDLGTVYHSFGTLALKAGTPNEALKWVEQGRMVFEKLRTDNPTVALYQWDCADSLELFGKIRLQARQYDLALAQFQAAQILMLDLLNKNPSIPLYGKNLADLYCLIGKCYHETGKAVEARKSYEQAAAMLTKLTRDHPRVGAFSKRLAEVNADLQKLARQ